MDGWMDGAGHNKQGKSLQTCAFFFCLRDWCEDFHFDAFAVV